MTSSLDPVLQSISPPKFDDALLHRGTLVDHILSSLDRKLIAIIAAAGYGKTSLLADFIKHSEIPIVFLRISEVDIDPEQLARLLSASLRRRFRRLSGRIDATFSAPQHPIGLARSLHSILDEHVPEPFVIMIDDIHYINRNDPVLEFMNALVLEAHDRMTFIIAGRSLPEIELGRLVVEGQMTGIGPAQLAFDRAEIQALVRNEANEPLSNNQLDQLLAETGGWIAGLRLSALLRKTSLKDVSHDRDLMYEYLANEVFADLPEDMQEFMEGVAVLPFMDPDLCDRLLGIEDSKSRLATLLRQGFFIHGAGDDITSYTFQISFRNFLIQHLNKKDPKRLETLRIQAAELLKDIGAVEHAVNLYFDAGQLESGAAIINESAAQFHHTGRLRILQEWAGQLRGQVQLAPDLFLALAAMHIDRGELEQADAELDLIRKVIGRLPQGDRKVNAVRVMILQGWIQLHRSNIEATLEVAAELDELLDGNSPPQYRASHLRIKGLAYYRGSISISEAERLILQAVSLIEEQSLDSYLLAHTLQDLCAVQMELGKEHNVYRASQRAYDIFREVGSPDDLATALNNLGMIEYLTGSYDAALKKFQEGLKYAHQANNLNIQAILFTSQADLFNDAGVIQAAGELYDHALRSASSTNKPRLHGYIYSRVAALHRRNAAFDSAEEWLSRAAEQYSIGDKPIEFVIEELALRCYRNPETTISYLNELIERFSDAGKNGPLAKTIFLQSVAHQLLEDSGLAEGIFSSLLRGALDRHSLQWLAAELYHHQNFYEQLKNKQFPHPQWVELERRIGYLSVISENWTPPEGRQDQTTSLVLNALGQSLVERAGFHSTDLEPLHRRLLYYLMEFGPVDRDVILEDFWPDFPPGRQTASLYTALHGIRAALGDDILDTHGSLYQINPDLSIAYDAAEFERLVTLAESIPIGDPRGYFALREAMQLYGGDFLPEFTQDWILRRRRGLEMLQVDVLRQFSEAAFAKGRPEETRRALQAALEIEPLHDGLHHEYLRILGALGMRSEIVSHYQHYSRLLRDELGLDPPLKTRQLYAELIK